MAEKEELGKIVGAKNVFDDPEILEEYSKDQSFARPIKPRYVVKPKNAEEVKRIVQWANETLTPLIPVSSGPPHFRGDTVPSTGGAVIIDLSRMKKIIRIDRRNKVALVEPGVTFSELQPELAKEGLRLPMPLCPRASKSVVGSMLEREPHIIPKYHWDISDPLRCTEVVWGNGETLMTGDAGGLGPLEEQWKVGVFQKNPMGPAQVDFYKIIQGAQGTMGIVTWASASCELIPRLQKLLFVPSETIENLLDFAHRLLKFRCGDEFFFLNSFDLASLLGEKPDQIAALREALPPWVLILGIGGYEVAPELRVESQEKDMMDTAQQFGLIPMTSIPGVSASKMLGILRSPSKEPYWKFRYKGSCHDIFFLTTLKRTPDFIRIMYSVAEAYGYATTQIGIYLQPVVQGVGCHCEFSLPFNQTDSVEVAKVKKLSTESCQSLINMGAFFSRPYGAWADVAYRRDAESTAALRKVKGIFDPNNVMNPGKLCF